MMRVVRLNDTGNERFTFRDTDFASLGDLSDYHPLCTRAWVITANDIVFMIKFRVQLQLLRQDG